MLHSALVPLSLYRNGQMCFELCIGHHRVSRLLVFPSSNLKRGNQDVSMCMWEAVCVGSALQLMAPVCGWAGTGQLSVPGGSLLHAGLWAVPMGVQLQHLGYICFLQHTQAPALTTLADGFSPGILICFSG